MKLKKLISIVIMVSLLLSVTGSSLAKANTGAYNYPVVPGTSEWLALRTHVEKIKACQIPEDILESMSTEDLVETVLNYPLRVDMLVWDTSAIGYHQVQSQFNGLQELAKRTDALSKLITKKDNARNTDTLSAESETLSLESAYIDTIANGISAQINKKAAEKDGVIPLYTTTYVYTPNGSSVQVLYNCTWTDFGTNYIDAQDAFEEELANVYPYALKLTNSNPAYNCHSYAWYSTSATNKYWMGNPAAYMTDGSYTSGSAASGRKVYYDGGDHSGIIFSVYNGYIGVRSKWGVWGTVEHDIYDCPYSGLNTNYSFWYR